MPCGILSWRALRWCYCRVTPVCPERLASEGNPGHRGLSGHADKLKAYRIETRAWRTAPMQQIAPQRTGTNRAFFAELYLWSGSSARLLRRLANLRQVPVPAAARIVF